MRRTQVGKHNLVEISQKKIGPVDPEITGLQEIINKEINASRTYSRRQACRTG